ncbi:GNAT family N-acetyltransferase [Rivibacter subsaxonicus]|uniref:Acetyltransferase (GNAT) family protein n=1 Tax=Rivibacter subsaxonicus TaxID=457575 RepID=A0A4V2FUP3_9BURK|nr:GNAT family N-acetyltransferase [Rivibacter subsaxonicus]RZU02736.1 acetyltransferase (GNAT) family protein [Rivibacter subsaxonicus]
MKLAELGPGWETDFFLHREDALVSECDDCIVVRTPSSPSFYWGNCLLLPAPPADAELAHWLQRFEAEIGALQPQSSHVAIGINAVTAPPSLPSWEAAGFEHGEYAVLELRPDGLEAPVRAARGRIEVRELDIEAELPALVDLHLSTRDGFDEAGYRLHREQQMRRYARMAREGRAAWFGLWCDGVLAADCGLVRDGKLGRFQRVAVHPDWRRLGLASALVHAVSAHGFERLGLRLIRMCADPLDVAIGIYRSLGYRQVASEWWIERRAPQDRK